MRITTLGFIVCVTLAVSLSGCGYSTEEAAVKNKLINSKVPKNCELSYFGEYYAPTGITRPALIIPVVAVQCDGKKVTTVNSVISVTQQTIVQMEDRESDFVIEELKSQEDKIKKRIILKKIQGELPLSDEEWRMLNTWNE